jgi:hypothetical protein
MSICSTVAAPQFDKPDVLHIVHSTCFTILQLIPYAGKPASEAAKILIFSIE